MGSGDERQLHEVVNEVVTAAGFDLEELAVRAAGRRRIVRVVIDGDDGVTLDAAAEVSRAISERLDAAGEADPTGSAPYTLEVTSPGIGRPLTLPRHFRRARTRLVSVTTVDGKDTAGHVLGVDDTAVTLVLSGRKGVSQISIPLAEITRARVEVEFSPPSAAVLSLLGVQPPVEPDDDAELEDVDADDADPDDDEDADTDADENEDDAEDEDERVTR
ncbi:ribosome maturation factor RimP [Nakamurella sp. GG22]